MTNYLWKGTGASHNGDWETAADWRPMAEPGAGDFAQIYAGTVTEDVQEERTVNGAVNNGVQLGSLYVATGATLVVGDSTDTNQTIMTIAGSINNVVTGALDIEGVGGNGGRLRMSGTITTSKSGSPDGIVNIDGGEFLADGTLTLKGTGGFAIDGGYIGGTSSNSTNSLLNYSTISGIGVITAINTYAAPPAAPFSGAQNFNGLTTFNYGTIDATNVDSGRNYLYIEGGVIKNYGVMEATNAVSGSTGTSNLLLADDAIVYNLSGGTMSTGTDDFIAMEGATIYGGALSATIGAYSSSNAISSFNKGTLTNNGAIFAENSTLTLTAATGGLFDNKDFIQAYDDGVVHLYGAFTNEANATIASYTNGSVSSGSYAAITNNGDLFADGGALTFNNAVNGGQADIANGGFLTFNYSANTNVVFDGDGGSLAFGTNDTHGGGPLQGTVSGFTTGEKLYFENVAYSSLQSITSCSWTQGSGDSGTLQIGNESITLIGQYAASGTSYTFGGDGDQGNAGGDYFTISKPPHVPGTIVTLSAPA